MVSWETVTPRASIISCMIGLDRVIGVPLADMARRGQQLSDHSRVGRRLIGADLARAWAVLPGTGEEPASGRQVPLLTDQHVDDLSELVNRPVQIHPLPATLT